MVTLKLSKIVPPKVFLIFYDITKRQSFEKIGEYIKMYAEDKKTKSVVIVANKIDSKAARCVSVQEGLALASKNGALYL